MRIDQLKLGSVNAYLVRNDNDIFLIDTGNPGDLDKLIHLLEEKDVVPQSIKLILLTHGHMDHAGNALALHQRYGIPIAMNDADIHLDPMFSTGIVGRVILSASQQALKALLPFSPDVLLSEDADLTPCQFPGQILFLPGHSKGSVAYYFPEDKTLVAGDMYMNFLRPTTALIFEDAAALINSHHRIQQLPIETIYPGHGKPFSPSQIK